MIPVIKIIVLNLSFFLYPCLLYVDLDKSYFFFDRFFFVSVVTVVTGYSNVFNLIFQVFVVVVGGLRIII